MRAFVPMIVYGKNKVIKCYGLLDGGATRSVLKSKIATELGLDVYSRNTKVITLDSNSTGKREFADFELGNLEGNYKTKVKGAIVDREILTLENDTPPRNED